MAGYGEGRLAGLTKEKKTGMDGRESIELTGCVRQRGGRVKGGGR